MSKHVDQFEELDMAMLSYEPSLEHHRELVQYSTGETVLANRDAQALSVHILRTHPISWPARNRPRGAFLHLMRSGSAWRLDVTTPTGERMCVENAHVRDLIHWIHAYRDGALSTQDLCRARSLH